MSDVIVEEIWRIREELIKRHGGIDSYFRYCQAQDRAEAARRRAKRRKAANGKTRKKTTPKK